MHTKTRSLNFVVIEGVDGVGKTTLARKLEEECGYYYLYTMPIPFKKIRSELESLQYPDARFFFYLTCVIAFQRELCALLNEGYKVVVDRYVYSTIVMHNAMGVNVECVNIKELPIMTPDISILLTCDSYERNKRILSRGLEKQEYIRTKGPMLDRAQLNFVSLKDVFQIIDTTNKTKDDIFRLTIAILRNCNA